MIYIVLYSVLCSPRYEHDDTRAFVKTNDAILQVPCSVSYHVRFLPCVKRIDLDCYCSCAYKSSDILGESMGQRDRQE